MRVLKKQKKASEEFEKKMIFVLYITFLLKTINFMLYITFYIYEKKCVIRNFRKQIETIIQFHY